MKLKKHLIISSIVISLVLVGLTNNLRVFSINSDQSILRQPQSSASEAVKIWDTTWGWSAFEFGQDITMDNDGNIYIVGTTDSFGSGGEDVFIAKYDATGNQLWNRTWGGVDHDRSYAIDTDSNGDVYIAGKCDFTSEDPGDAFLVKYSSEGSYLWENIVSWSEEETWFDITIDSTDAIYLAGKTESGIAEGFDVIFGKYDTSGNNQWGIIYVWGDSDYESGSAITVDNSGYAYITGITNSSTTGDYDAFLFKIDAAGYEVWNRTWGGSGDDVPQGIAVDNDGHIYINGGSDSPGTIGNDIFLTKYDDSGTQIWNIYWGQSGYESSADIIVNGTNSIYVCGSTSSANSSEEGELDVCLIKYNNSGAELWNLTWGGVDDENSRGITMNSAGYIYITGTTFSFGAGGTDAYILKYVENSPPSITSPADIEFNQGTSDQNSTWIITDLTVNNPTYTVYRNGTEYKTDSWTSGQPVVYNLDNNDGGSYNFTIVVSDGLGGSVQDEVLVTVISTTVPAISGYNLVVLFSAVGITTILLNKKHRR